MVKFVSQWIEGFILLLSLGVLSVIFAALVQSRSLVPSWVGFAIGLAYLVLVPWLSFHIARFVVGIRSKTERSIEKQSPFEEMLKRAFELDRRGDWLEAIELYEQVAEMLPEQKEGQYARNCAEHIRKKMASNA